MNVKDKKYYWLKLKKDFFKRHDIQIIESQKNGAKYVLFYLKLLAESVGHEGALRFNELIPYNEEMLSTITNTDIDTVRSAIKLLNELKMIDMMDDGTIYMTEVNNMLGHETYWAKKKREQRDNKLLDNVQPSPTCPSKSLDLELEKELKKDIEIKKDIDKPKKDSKIKFGKYSNVKLTQKEYDKLSSENKNIDFILDWFSAYIEEKGYKSKSHNLTIRRWVIDAYSKNNKSNSDIDDYQILYDKFKAEEEEDEALLQK